MVTVYPNSEDVVILVDGVPEIVSIPSALLTTSPDGVVADGAPSTIQERVTPTAPPE